MKTFKVYVKGHEASVIVKGEKIEEDNTGITIKDGQGNKTGRFVYPELQGWHEGGSDKP